MIVPKGIIANPNCTTDTAVPVLKVLHDEAQLVRMIASTYQAVSGSGLAGVELASRAVISCAEDLVRRRRADFPAPEKYVAPIAFNVIPLAGARSMTTQGRPTRIEAAQRESQVLSSIPTSRSAGPACRCRWFTGHSLSINAEFARPTHRARRRTAVRRTRCDAGRRVDPLAAAGIDDSLVG